MVIIRQNVTAFSREITIVHLVDNACDIVPRFMSSNIKQRKDDLKLTEIVTLKSRFHDAGCIKA